MPTSQDADRRQAQDLSGHRGFEMVWRSGLLSRSPEGLRVLEPELAADVVHLARSRFVEDEVDGPGVADGLELVHALLLAEPVARLGEREALPAPSTGNWAARLSGSLPASLSSMVPRSRLWRERRGALGSLSPPSSAPHRERPAPAGQVASYSTCALRSAAMLRAYLFVRLSAHTSKPSRLCFRPGACTRSSLNPKEPSLC